MFRSKGAIHSQLNWAILLCDRKKLVNCAVLTKIVQASELSFPVVFHTEICAVHSGNPIVLPVYLPTPWWHHLKALHSADKHRAVQSLPNTTSYCTFYGFFSPFRIILWPMWPANSKRQPGFYPPQSHAQEDTQNWQENWQTWWETCAVPENIQFSFSCSFIYTVNCTVYLRVYGPLNACSCCWR